MAALPARDLLTPPSRDPMHPCRLRVALAMLSLLPFASRAQTTPPSQPAAQPPAAAESRAVWQVYRQFCADCHGRRWEGVRAPSMLDDVWAHASDDAGLAASIRDGWPANGMPPFSAVLNESEIRALVMDIHEVRARVKRDRVAAEAPKIIDGRVIASELHTFKVELIESKLETPWGLAFLPDGRILLSERPGRLRIIELGRGIVETITGLPKIWVKQDGGLLDIALHPQFAENGWVYLAFTETGGKEPEGSTTKIIRGRIRDGALVDHETIFQAAPGLYWNSNIHFGTRFFFDRDGYLFFGLGDRGRPQLAQDLSSPYGKLHRVRADGDVPSGNPFVSHANAVKTIWSYGHRNQQGIAQDPATGELWATEHGPRGGDELNLIRPGRNYGWPIVTNGVKDDGTIPAFTTMEGMESPIAFWTPSIAPGALEFYRGNAFPKWNGHLFAASLAGRQLRRFEIKGREIVRQEAVFSDLGRVRDVVTGPDGCLYVILNSAFENSPGQLVRLSPVTEEK